MTPSRRGVVDPPRTTTLRLRQRQPFERFWVPGFLDYQYLSLLASLVRPLPPPPPPPRGLARIPLAPPFCLFRCLFSVAFPFSLLGVRTTRCIFFFYREPSMGESPCDRWRRWRRERYVALRVRRVPLSINLVKFARYRRSLMNFRWDLLVKFDSPVLQLSSIDDRLLWW